MKNSLIIIVFFIFHIAEADQIADDRFIVYINNLVDNFHYARNISLPGKIDDLYTVIFNVIPPSSMDLSLHKDWSINYGNSLFKQTSFKYKSVDFKEIAESSRN